MLGYFIIKTSFFNNINRGSKTGPLKDRDGKMEDNGLL